MARRQRTRVVVTDPRLLSATYLAGGRIALEFGNGTPGDVVLEFSSHDALVAFYLGLGRDVRRTKPEFEPDDDEAGEARRLRLVGEELVGGVSIDDAPDAAVCPDCGFTVQILYASLDERRLARWAGHSRIDGSMSATYDTACLRSLEPYQPGL